MADTIEEEHISEPVEVGETKVVKVSRIKIVLLTLRLAMVTQAHLWI